MWCHCVTARLTAAHTPDHRTAFKCEAEITTWWILCERKWNVSGVHECTWCKIMMKTCLDSVSVSFQKENKPKTQHCKSSFRRYWRQVFGWSLFYFLPLTTQLRRRAAAVWAADLVLYWSIITTRCLQEQDVESLPAAALWLKSHERWRLRSVSGRRFESTEDTLSQQLWGQESGHGERLSTLLTLKHRFLSGRSVNTTCADERWRAVWLGPWGCELRFLQSSSSPWLLGFPPCSRCSTAWPSRPAETGQPQLWCYRTSHIYLWL